MPQAANIAGFDDFYRDHNSWLRQLIARQLRCTETAADLTQDTFLRLISRGENLGDIREPRAYLTRIARGLVANHWRRRDIEQAYLEALRARPEPVASSPEEQQVVIETLCQVDRMLQDLPDRVRQAFLMSRLDVVRYAQIAQILDVSERTIKKYMAQAMLHCVRAAQQDQG